jgi:hypothetical protein
LGGRLRFGFRLPNLSIRTALIQKQASFGSDCGSDCEADHNSNCTKYDKHAPLTSLINNSILFNPSASLVMICVAIRFIQKHFLAVSEESEGSSAVLIVAGSTINMGDMYVIN